MSVTVRDRDRVRVMLLFRVRLQSTILANYLNFGALNIVQFPRLLVFYGVSMEVLDT